MNRRELLIAGLSFPFLKFAFAENKFINPKTVNPRLNVAYATAKLLAKNGFNEVGVVFMEDSQLCAVFAGALVTGLRILGKKAWYIEGGKDLIPSLKKYNPKALYMAYFGELPDEQVQEALNNDLKQLAKYGKPFKLIFHVSTLQRGYVGNAILEEDIFNYLNKVKELYAMKVIEGYVHLAKVSELSEFGVSFGKDVDKIKLIKFEEVGKK
ncbi:hypothetical protein [Aquifex aeolicus]|uniref:Uncharacterized protein aq_1850 n=1 Tax=Aquifex aeolicus (strain VF5) TaxID=224324 RepID=Y1850_AQUAE|nr:hypothetical protein [Aquifex aeolicus]O67702.1 RecName: Full=Uncharacterized protein aq_1850 [Aquifex aeolicus VF5]AAC07669.1 putative protein [Aquifex aeolicus VF5]